MLQKLRTQIIQFLIDLNEKVVFYPKLKKVYSEVLNGTFKAVVLDIGTNKGQSIEFFSQFDQVSRIFGFEPNPSLYKRLVLSYGGNNKVEIANLGVSSKNGKMIFYENLLDETSSFEELNYDSIYLKKKAKVLGVSPSDIITNQYEVEVIKINDFILNQNLTTVDVIKIDVEGHELHVLNGLFENKGSYQINYIQIESHEDDMYKNRNDFQSIPKILHENGFVEFKKIKHGFGDFYEVVYKNANL